MTKTLIEQIEDATTKDDLEPLAETLGVEINKRQGVETIRAELLEQAESATQEEGVPDKGDTQAPVESEAKATGPYKGRALKSRKNGRIFPYTAALAKKRDMEEV